MFPKEIVEIALFAIKHNEIETFNLMISKLYCWMDSIDNETADAAYLIGNALFEYAKTNKNKIGFVAYYNMQKTVSTLFRYSVEAIDSKIIDSLRADK